MYRSVRVYCGGGRRACSLLLPSGKFQISPSLVVLSRGTLKRESESHQVTENSLVVYEEKMQ